MNFIILMCDTLRYDHLGCTSSGSIHTPALDRFAAEAVSFTQCRVGSYATIPARLEFFTGTVGQPFQPWRPLPWDTVTLPEILREHGYVTMLINDTPHLINHGYGFDRPFHGWHMVRGHEVDRWQTGPAGEVALPCAPEKLKNPDTFLAQYLRNQQGRQWERDWQAPRLMQAAMDWLERNRDHQRFFLWIDCFTPHEPWDPPRRYVERYDPGYQGEEVIFPKYGAADYMTAAELRHVQALYAASVSLLDRWIGLLLEAVDSFGLRENTAVLLLSDHGTMNGDRGIICKPPPLYEGIAHTLFLLRHPSEEGAGRRQAGLLQAADLAPTVLDLAGISPPSSMDGQPAWRLIQGDSSKRAIVASGMARPGAGVTVYDGEWTLILEPGQRCELYHLPSDPEQQHDRSTTDGEVAQRLQHAWLAELERRAAPAAWREAYALGAASPVSPMPPDPFETLRQQRGLNGRNFLQTPVVTQERTS